MATGQVRAGFSHTWTRPAGQDPWPGPTPFRVPGFFPGPGLAPIGPPFRDWAQFVAQPKKKKSPDLFLPFIPNKKIKSKFIFAYIQACIFKFKPR